MTWNEYLRRSEQKLAEAGIEDARTNVEYLSAHLLGFKNRSDLRRNLKSDVLKVESEQFELLLNRRISREPLQYILGEWEFYGIPIQLNPTVLIPRPETELLVEHALEEAKRIPGNLAVLDIGTGSGCIAIALAKHLEHANVLGIDRSAEAIQLARSNARMSLQQNRESRVEFRVDDIFSADWENYASSKFDLIVSNPPYVSKTDFESLEPELRLYEPRHALTDGADGLTFYKRIAELAPNLLKKDGRLLLELGYGMAEDVRKIIETAGLDVIRIENDLAKIPRVLVARYMR